MLTLLQSHPHLRLRVTVGLLTVEIEHASLPGLSKWLIAAQTHARRKDDDRPVQFRCYLSGYCEIGVEGVIGETTWIECRLRYMQGSALTPLTIQIPAYIDPRGGPVRSRVIRL
jgi:hypothetical protein